MPTPGIVVGIVAVARAVARRDPERLDAEIENPRRQRLQPVDPGIAGIGVLGSESVAAASVDEETVRRFDRTSESGVHRQFEELFNSAVADRAVTLRKRQKSAVLDGEISEQAALDRLLTALRSEFSTVADALDTRNQTEQAPESEWQRRVADGSTRGLEVNSLSVEPV